MEESAPARRSREPPRPHSGEPQHQPCGFTCPHSGARQRNSDSHDVLRTRTAGRGKGTVSAMWFSRARTAKRGKGKGTVSAMWFSRARTAKRGKGKGTVSAMWFSRARTAKRGKGKETTSAMWFSPARTAGRGKETTSAMIVSRIHTAETTSAILFSACPHSGARRKGGSAYGYPARFGPEPAELPEF